MENHQRPALIPIGKSKPVSIVSGEPPDLASILVPPSEALLQRRFVLWLVPLKSQAGMDRLPRSDRVAEYLYQIDYIQRLLADMSKPGDAPSRSLARPGSGALRCRRTEAPLGRARH
jgi:hypothetical protein